MRTLDFAGGKINKPCGTQGAYFIVNIEVTAEKMLVLGLSL